MRNNILKQVAKIISSSVAKMGKIVIFSYFGLFLLKQNNLELAIIP